MRIIAGELKGRRLDLPGNSQARPTSDKARGAVFNILANDLPHAKVLDMFAGSGAMGVEALSRGADWAVFIELDRDNVRALRESLLTFRLDEDRYLLLQGDFRQRGEQLLREGCTFDLIFLDPPYAGGFYQDALVLSEKLLAPEGHVVVEYNRSMQTPAAEGLVCTSVRAYGTNTMAFYRKESHEPLDLSREL